MKPQTIEEAAKALRIACAEFRDAVLEAFLKILQKAGLFSNWK